eukprot:CAMPEP_0197624068 /NCGR_PEP_ID=MMETSP1338-20131121/3870_1 /TAXON_ID=43686 ORGANISM="Pelagodinium beii, Strain RCC1491" /NCGR_SAMPLE_ID=MMETSP1338 /ASSEMBLY_ACC=CAM_ASM_000754 /LENGTH=189 /DNA_ID=CAMNT_0043194165 /DNA_START=86 /DNA_END=655 /DNA_ORIENTATION=+
MKRVSNFSLGVLAMLISTDALTLEVDSRGTPQGFYTNATHDWTHTPVYVQIANCTIDKIGGDYQIRTDYSVKDATEWDCSQTMMLVNEAYVPTRWDNSSKTCLATKNKECGADCSSLTPIVDCESMAEDTCNRTCQVHGTAGSCASLCKWHQDDRVCYAGGMLVVPDDWPGNTHKRFCIGMTVDLKQYP